jgi:hypothetical protein
MNSPVLAQILASRAPWAMLAAGLLSTLVLWLATRSVLLHPPLYDELLHILSARGVVTTGGPAILDGVYTRAEPFTRIVALALEWRGDNLASARLPSLLSAAGLVLLTAAWVTRHAGLLAGATASLLLAMTTATIGLAVFVRFYTLHALVMLFLYVAAFEALVSGRSRSWRAVWALLAVAVLPFAWRLQVTTLIAAGAAVAGVIVVVAFDGWTRLGPLLRRHAIAYSVMATLLIVGGALVVHSLGLLEKATQAPVWAAARSGDIAFYNRALGIEWPLFWPLFPLAVLAAIAGFGRFALYCTVVAIAAIAVHSVSAAKALRYVYYAMPMLSAVIGCAVAYVIQVISRGLPQRWRALRPGVALLVALLLVSVVAANSQEARSAARFVAGRADWRDLTMYASESDWTLAMPVLLAFAGADSTLVVSSAVKGIYHFGDYDYELNVSTVFESETREEFGRDRRTGRPSIGTRESLARVLDDSSATLIVADSDKIGSPIGVAEPVVGLIAERCAEVAVPTASRVRAWRCGPEVAEPSTSLSN